MNKIAIQVLKDAIAEWRLNSERRMSEIIEFEQQQCPISNSLLNSPEVVKDKDAGLQAGTTVAAEL